MKVTKKCDPKEIVVRLKTKEMPFSGFRLPWLKPQVSLIENVTQPQTFV